MIWWPQYNDSTFHQGCTNAGRNIDRAPRILRWLIHFLKKLLHPLLSSDMWRPQPGKISPTFQRLCCLPPSEKTVQKQILHTFPQHSQENFPSHILKRSRLETFGNKHHWTQYERSIIHGFNQYQRKQRHLNDVGMHYTILTELRTFKLIQI
jgi:hypothetical protein